MIIPAKKKILTYLIAFLSVLLALTWLAAVPLMMKIREISADYSKNKEILFKLDQRETLVKNIETEYQAKEEELKNVEFAFIGPEETVGFIYTLEKLAQETNNVFEIKTVSPFNPLKQEQTPFIGFRISLWGSYNKLLRFIAGLENTPYPPYRLIEIESLNVRRLSDSLVKQGITLSASDIETTLNIKIFTK